MTIRPLAAMSMGGMFSQTRQSMPRPRGIAASERKIDVLIISSEPPASGAVEPVDVVKPFVPAAIFIAVEILLAAETISVVLLRAIDPQNPGAAVIAILLSVAL